jgi:hypothetical protein
MKRVLLDHCVPRPFRDLLVGCAVSTANETGWAALKNGELLDAAEAAGFDVLVTTDRNIRSQQNLTGRKLAIVVLGKARWKLIKRKLTEITAAVAAATPGSYTEVDIPDR